MAMNNAAVMERSRMTKSTSVAALRATLKLFALVGCMQLSTVPPPRPKVRRHRQS